MCSDWLPGMSASGNLEKLHQLYFVPNAQDCAFPDNVAVIRCIRLVITGWTFDITLIINR
jgi:hypothetical protein